MSDLFHKDVPFAFIAEVFHVMAACPHHTFQVLTKRPKRMAGVLRDYYDSEGREPLANVWLGTSIESNTYVWRADHIRDAPGAVRFISAEPLLGPLDALDLSNIDWLIVGGESGADFRFIDPKWVRSLRDRCALEGVAFFFKQWGGIRPKSHGRELDGRTWDEMPRRCTLATA